ncbi:hypothetical protein ACIG6B_07960 [Bacillus mobilis]|uniref:hypothetical protein n=1 Tax=Bacillus mobilis TaxID=2026190 RepID=UPI00277D165A|nr:hypothetical protein [Bacillus thuringiensis]
MKQEKEDITINLLSIPRETQVYLTIKAIEDKISHAFGSIDSTLDTVEKFLDIPTTFTEQDYQDQADAIHLENRLNIQFTT